MFHYIVFVEKNKEQSYSEFFATLQKVNKGNNIQALNKKIIWIIICDLEKNVEVV